MSIIIALSPNFSVKSNNTLWAGLPYTLLRLGNIAKQLYVFTETAAVMMVNNVKRVLTERCGDYYGLR